MEMRIFNLSDIDLTKYLFFTGKGGVGKTSIACATAVGLADNGKKILLISTDPASNLQDVFNQTLNGHGTDIQEVPGLTVVNLDPEEAAAEYRESVIAPFRGQLPESVIQNMEEQLSGSCTVEIAAFNQFSDFITDADKAKEYDHIIFDTAPTGHTLRMLQLPSAWSTFISESTHGASCLGQLSGLEERKGIYKQAVETLSDANATRLVLVSRPEIAPLKEAARSSHELQLLGIKNQLLVINGLLLQLDEADSVSKQIYDRQQTALKQTPAELLDYPSYSVPLRSYNLSNIANIRRMLYDDNLTDNADYQRITDAKGIDELVNDLYQSGKRVVFTMGKGGVGKTTTSINLAASLGILGKKTLLVDLDPQGNATTGVGIEKGDLKVSLYDALIDAVEPSKSVKKTKFKNLDLIPSSMKLAGIEIEFVDKQHSDPTFSKGSQLKRVLYEIRDNYDYILIDCPPSLGLLNTNALTAADSILIPVQCEYYALEGLSQLIHTIELVQERLNPNLEIEGVVFTMYDARTNLSLQVVENVKDNLNQNIYKTIIPRNVRLAEAPSYGLPINLYDPKSKGTESYMLLAEEVINKGE